MRAVEGHGLCLELSHKPFLTPSLAGTLLNAIVLAQILVYGRRAAKGKTE